MLPAHVLLQNRGCLSKRALCKLIYFILHFIFINVAICSYKGENTLRPYQLEGLNWLVFCWYQRRNSILADEMGLGKFLQFTNVKKKRKEKNIDTPPGKTVQAVSTVNHLRTVHNLRGPFLVVAPLSSILHFFFFLSFFHLSSHSMTTIIYSTLEERV